MRSTVLAVAVTAVLGGLAVPSFAGTLPVGVTYNVKDGVSVGTTVNGQPGAGASSRDGRTCVGFSYQVPQCVGTTPALATSVPLPSVQVSNDDDMVGVGVSDGAGGGAGVGVKKDGSGVCTAGLRYGGPYCITR